MSDEWARVVNAEDVPESLLDYAVETADSWFDDGRIDWDDLIDRLEGFRLPDGRRVDFGTDMDSPTIRRIKAHVRKVRRESPR